MNNEEQHQETQSQPSHPKLLPGVDYTVNQYTGDIVLLASGARKLITFYGYHAEPRLLKHLESLKPGQERVKYVVQVNLVDREDTVVSSGLGSCSSDESRHRYRWLTETRLAELGIQEETLKDAPVIEKKGPEGAIKLRRVRNRRRQHHTQGGL